MRWLFLAAYVLFSVGVGAGDMAAQKRRGCEYTDWDWLAGAFLAPLVAGFYITDGLVCEPLTVNPTEE